MTTLLDLAAISPTRYRLGPADRALAVAAAHGQMAARGVRPDGGVAEETAVEAACVERRRAIAAAFRAAALRALAPHAEALFRVRRRGRRGA